MRRPRLRRLALWGGALALLAGPGLAVGQSGTPTEGPPVTNPRTNQGPGQTGKSAAPGTPLSGGGEGTPAAPRTTADILPGVPATASDPAPPGTRAVRTDLPGAPGTGAMPPVNRFGGRPANAMVAEGVLTRIDRTGPRGAGETFRFALDPSRDWASYASRGMTAAGGSTANPTPDTGFLNLDKRDQAKGDTAVAPTDPAANTPTTPRTARNLSPVAANAVAPPTVAPGVMEMVVTPRTYVYSFGRTRDGVDLIGMPLFSTADGRSMGMDASKFREGSFVSVRYRRVGGVTELLNLTLIDVPTNQPPAAANRTGLPAAATANRTGLPGAAATTAPVRVPVVPLTPAGVGSLPR